MIFSAWRAGKEQFAHARRGLTEVSTIEYSSFCSGTNRTRMIDRVRDKFLLQEAGADVRVDRELLVHILIAIVCALRLVAR